MDEQTKIMGTRIYKEKNHYIVRMEEEKLIKIPSQMFPLKGLPEFYGPHNTEDFEDEAVREIFDGIKFNLGLCYHNTKAIMDKIKEAGIKGAEAYAGWVIPPTGYPVHHTFVLYKGKHVLDPSASIRMDDVKHLENETGEVLRENISDLYIQRQNLSNSERGAFGKASDLYLYIVSKQEPMDALKTIKKIMETYPNHPSYRNTDKRGYNQTVKRIYQKMGDNSRGF